MRRSSLNSIGGFLLATLLSVPVWGANPGQPGTINYVEGQVSMGGHAITPNVVGSAQLNTGQTLTTENGKAEILLTPGVFVRVADNSSVTMVSPDLANTEVRVGKGCAMVEVGEIHKENNLLIDQGSSTTRLVKTGLYDFNADRGLIRVFDGQAVARLNQGQVELKGSHELAINGPAKAQKFDKDNFEDSFYRWASLRSDYLAEANLDTARYYTSRGTYWVNAGWYWDPWFGAYTFLPADGVFYSPFGWSYFSPWWVYTVPLAHYGHDFHRFDSDFHHAPHLGANGRAPWQMRSFGGFAGVRRHAGGRGR